MENVVISFSVDNSQLVSTVEILKQQGAITDKDAEKFKAMGEAAQKGADNATTHVKETSGEIDRLENRMRVLAERIVAAFAVERIIEFGKESVQAFAEQEKGRVQLLNSLNGQKDVQQRLIAQAEELKTKVGIDPDVIIKQQAFLAIQGRTESQIGKVVQAAIELSAVTGEDLASSVFKLNATFEGNVGRLGKLDKGFTELSKKQLENGGAIDLVNKKYAGFAEGTINTTAGKLALAGVKFDEAKKQLGALLVFGLTPLIDGFTHLFGVIGDLGKSDFEKLNSEFKDQSKVLNNLTNNINPLLSRYDELKSKTNLNTGEQKELKDIIQKVGEALPTAITGFDQYGKAIDISSSAARGLIQAQRDLTAFKNAQAIKEAETQINDLDRRAKALIAELNRGTKVVLQQGESVSVKLTSDDVRDRQAEVAKLNEQVKGLRLSERELKGESLIDPQEEKAVQSTTKSLNELKDELEDLKKQQGLIADPTGKDKAAFDKLAAQIVATQKLIDQLSGKTAEEFAKKRQEALKGLTEDALKEQQKIAVSQAKADADALIELQTTEQNKLLVKQQGFEKQKQAELSGLIALEREKAKIAGVKFDNNNQVVGGDPEAIKKFSQFVIAATKNTDLEVLSEKSKTNDSIFKLNQELNSKNQDNDLQATLSSIDLSAEIQKQAIIKSFVDKGDFSKQAELKLQQDLIDIDKKAGEVKIKEEEKVIEAKIAAGENVDENEKKLAALRLLRLKNDNSEIVKNAEHTAEIEIEIAKKKKDKILELTQTLISGIIDLNSAQAENDIFDANKQRDDQNKAIDDELSALEEKHNKHRISDKKFAEEQKRLQKEKEANDAAALKKENEIKHSGDIANRERKAFEIAIATFRNVTEVGVNPVLIPYIIALGAAEEALLFAQPLPKYHKGKLRKDSSREVTAIIREDETIFDPQTSREYDPVLRAIFNRKINPRILNDFVNLNLKKDLHNSFATNVSNSMQFNYDLMAQKLGSEIVYRLKNDKTMNLSNESINKLASAIDKTIDPRRS